MRKEFAVGICLINNLTLLMIYLLAICLSDRCEKRPLPPQPSNIISACPIFQFLKVNCREILAILWICDTHLINPFKYNKKVTEMGYSLLIGDSLFVYRIFFFLLAFLFYHFTLYHFLLPIPKQYLITDDKSVWSVPWRKNYTGRFKMLWKMVILLLIEM